MCASKLKLILISVPWQVADDVICPCKLSDFNCFPSSVQSTTTVLVSVLPKKQLTNAVHVSQMGRSIRLRDVGQYYRGRYVGFVLILAIRENHYHYHYKLPLPTATTTTSIATTQN